ncbi:hypothetical protein [Dyadobacter sp. 32]|uniref:hypothetical protein n=1 Tax=Dyadobacter sp. 32 TaxID=538966 RepID=UPI0011EC476A
MIEDLQKVEAVEVIEETTGDNVEIVEWQKALVLSRLKELREFSERLVSITDAEQRQASLEDNGVF